MRKYPPEYKFHEISEISPFQILNLTTWLAYFDLYFPKGKDFRKSRITQKKSGHPNTLNPENQLLLTPNYLRNYNTQLEFEMEYGIGIGMNKEWNGIGGTLPYQPKKM